MIKQVFITLYFSVTFSVHINAQDHFFLMTDDWQTLAVEEKEDEYVLIGNGSTGVPNHNHYINFTKISKITGDTSQWRYPMQHDELFTTTRVQQSYNFWGNKRILMNNFFTNSSSKRKAGRLIIDDNVSQVLDNSWYYPTSDDAWGVWVYPINENKILNGLTSQDANNLDKVRLRFVATDSIGSILWQNDYPCPDRCWMFPKYVIPTQDGGYVLTSEELREPPPLGPGHEVSTLIKTDSVGEFEWQIYPGGVGMPYTSNDILAVATDDGNILCTWTDRRKLRETDMSYQLNEDRTIWFAKIDLEGNKIWEKNITEELEAWNPYEYFQELFQMIPLSNGNIAISTSRMLLKVTQDAELIWARDITPPLFNPPNAGEFSWITLLGLIETSDGGFLCTGEAQLLPGDAFPEFEQTGFVIKVDEHGCLEEGCQLVDVEEVVEEEKAHLSIFPNPTTQAITINYHLPRRPDQLSLNIHDLTGKAVHTQPLLTQESSVNIELDKKLPAGTYFCHLIADGQVIGVERLILMR